MRRFLPAGETRNQFVRFVAVGILNTIVGYSLFSLFIFLNFHYALAALLATVLGVLFNFKSIGKLVFGSHDNRLIFRFFWVYGIIYVLNVMALKVFAEMAFNMYLAGAILLVPSALLSFILNKKFVFHRKSG